MIAPVRFSCLLYGPYRIPLQEKTPPDIGGAGYVIVGGVFGGLFYYAGSNRRHETSGR